MERSRHFSRLKCGLAPYKLVDSNPGPSYYEAQEKRFSGFVHIKDVILFSLVIDLDVQGGLLNHKGKDPVLHITIPSVWFHHELAKQTWTN